MVTTTNPVEVQELRDQCQTGLVLRFTLPELPVSSNRMYGQEYDRELGYTVRGLSAEHRLWRTRMGEWVPARSRFKIAATSEIEAHVVFYYRYRHKNGNLRRFDSNNLLKSLLDLVSKRLGFDDFRVRSGSWSSVDSEQPKVQIELREIKLT